MKYLYLFIYLCLAYANTAFAQTFPMLTYDARRTDKGLVIKKITVTKQYTICDMFYTYSPKDNETAESFIYIVQDMHIYDIKTQAKYYVIKTENIPMQPGNHGFKKEGEFLRFKVFFPRIDPMKTLIFHILEDNDRGFKFYNVRLMPVA